MPSDYAVLPDYSMPQNEKQQQKNHKRISKWLQYREKDGFPFLGEAVETDYSFGVSAKLSSAFTHSFPSTNPLPSAK